LGKNDGERGAVAVCCAVWRWRGSNVEVLTGRLW
jgi:hypothetical protein